jgi:formylglycine-generating enzyme required for sulfatase activity
MIKQTKISLVILLTAIASIHGYSKTNPININYVYIEKSADKYSKVKKAFWISQHEITNKQYNEFLREIKEKNSEVYKICRVHDKNWNNIQRGKYKYLAKTYSTSKKYENFPVLNISHKAAKLFCNWLTEKYKNKTYKFTLPTKEQWIYAAKGGKTEVKYPWGNSELKTKSGTNKCNYRDHYFGSKVIMTKKEEITEILNKNNQEPTVEVNSYSVNPYGLYNCSGNVAEMITEEGIAVGGSWNNNAENVRIDSQFKYNQANPYTGFRPIRIKIQ